MKQKNTIFLKVMFSKLANAMLDSYWLISEIITQKLLMVQKASFQIA